ncbi:MAG TPA: glycosyltransferase family 4 protein [Candidatus Eisenbacteria bacterium]|nr:glycosyltransferase family 4 protein [Candidatus Eisenbacteria bacterium]
MKKLRIAQVAPLWFTVPPNGYGGIERVIKLLSDGLVDRGHAVTLFAAPGSDTKAELRSVYHSPLIADGKLWSNPIWNLRNIQKAVEAANAGEFDVVHIHLDLWGLLSQGVSRVPIVHTMHNPLYRSNADADINDRVRLYNEEAPRTNIAFISEAARKAANIDFPKGRVVYNGVDHRELQFDPKGGDHFIWIARLDKHKGVENAIAAAERAGAKLMLASRVDASRQEYFDTVIRPHLNDRITFVGEMTKGRFSEFYGKAKALLYPIEWEEPFGLVVAEAMACGTPVIAYDRGAMREIIDDGVTGFVVPRDDVDAFAEAMAKIDTIDRAKVRDRVDTMFGADHMTDSYERFYYDLLA